MLIYKIHPAIGVARVGNAPDEFFIGPEREDELVQPPGGFKDAQCRVKRQAVRFYIYEHDTDTGATREMTEEIGNITWHFDPRCGRWRSGDTSVYSEPEVSGRLDRDTFTLTIHAGTATPDVVPCGELRTDDKGRLVFLGGFGMCAPIPGSGDSPPLTTAYDPNWYDDTCEGPIRARFTHGGTDHEIYAWALVAPPRSSPHSPPSPSLYEELVDLANAEGYTVHAPAPGTPYALDKAQLHFVSGLAPGIEVYISAITSSYASRFRSDDGLRLRSTASILSGYSLASGAPSPWQADAYNCGWAVWTASPFASIEDMRLNWPTAGVSVRQGAGFIVTEDCNAALSITLLTPNLDFGQVPRGPGGMSGTALRAIVFEVRSTASAVTLAVDSGPTPAGPFTVEGAAPGPVGPGSAVHTVRFWIRYTTTGAVADDASIVIRHAGTSTTWTIPLHAESVARRTTAVALVLDHSGSMGEHAGAAGTEKVDLLRFAAKDFLDLAHDGDFIQLVRYDHTAEAVPAVTTTGVSGSAVTELTAATRSALQGMIDGSAFDPAGATSIGAGILVGRDRLATVVPDPVSGALPHRAMVILTDGMENHPPYVTSVASSVDSTTYAIGLGTPANTSAPVLQALSGNHGGYLLVTGAITDENSFLLEKYFLQVLAGINKAEVVLDPDGVLSPGTEHAIPFELTAGDSGFEAILLTPHPGAVDFRIATPAGRVLEPWRALGDPTLSFGLGSRVAFYRVALPAELEPGLFEKGGTWHALLRIGRPRLSSSEQTGSMARRPSLVARYASGEKERAELLAQAYQAAGRRKAGLPYSFLAHAYSSIALRATLTQSGFSPGATVTLRASLLDSGALPVPGVELRAEVTPDRALPITLRLRKVKGQPGHYEATFAASAAGVYRCRVRARGRTSRGERISREQTLTAQVWYGGDRDALDPNERADPSDELRELVCALLGCLAGPGGVIRPELAGKLAQGGIDLDHLQRCLARLCKGRRPSAHEISRALELARSKRSGDSD